MRRKDREITGRENIEPILQACKVCRVAMTGTGRLAVRHSDELWLHMG